MTPRLYLSLFLSLLLTVSSVGFGMARGLIPPAGQMVICTGNGLITVSFDANGQPVESHTLCPDSVMSLQAAVAVPPLGAESDVPLGRQMIWVDPTLVVEEDGLIVYGARAPPMLG